MRRNIKRNLPSNTIVCFGGSSSAPVKRKLNLVASNGCDSGNDAITTASTSGIINERNLRIGDTNDVMENGEGKTASDYKKRQENSAKNWATIRSQLLSAVVESECLPDQSLCGICGTAPATFRCTRCGIGILFCQQCVASLHSNVSLFHVIEEWKVIIALHLDLYLYVVYYYNPIN